MSMMRAAGCRPGRHRTNRMEVCFNIGAGMCLSLLVDYPPDPRRSRHPFRRCFAAELPFPSADAFSFEAVFTAAFFGVTIRTRCARAAEYEEALTRLNDLVRRGEVPDN
jgi:hypothetical protein